MGEGDFEASNGIFEGDFEASNGIFVGEDAEGRISVSWSSPRNRGWTIHTVEESQALREYFSQVAGGD